MMETEVFRLNDFSKVVQAWWYAWHGEPLNERLMSKFGVVVLEDNEPIAVSFIYPASTADIAWIGFTMRSPFISPFLAGKALKLLVEEAETAVRDLGYSIIYTASDSTALQKIVASRGYFPGSQVKEYFKEIS